MSRKIPTDTLIGQGKRQAKAASREGLAKHGQALDNFAADAGYASWTDLVGANARRARDLAAGEAVAAPSPIPIDPALPENFDSTPNEDRSREDLDLWWDRPFAITNPDGALTVRCLDGGAWDRSTNYGDAMNAEEAAKLGADKLTAWRKAKRRPIVSMNGDGTADVVVMASRPDRDAEILAEKLSLADAHAFIERGWPG